MGPPFQWIGRSAGLFATSLLLTAVVFADDVVIGQTKYENVLIKESRRAFYVLVPDGSVEPVPKDRTPKPATVMPSSDLERERIYYQWRTIHQKRVGKFREERQARVNRERGEFGRTMAARDLPLFEEAHRTRFDRETKQILANIQQERDRAEAMKRVQMAQLDQTPRGIPDVPATADTNAAPEKPAGKTDDARAEIIQIVSDVVKRGSEPPNDGPSSLEVLHEILRELN